MTVLHNKPVSTRGMTWLQYTTFLRLQVCSAVCSESDRATLHSPDSNNLILSGGAFSLFETFLTYLTAVMTQEMWLAERTTIATLSNFAFLFTLPLCTLLLWPLIWMKIIGVFGPLKTCRFVLAVANKMSLIYMLNTTMNWFTQVGFEFKHCL